jgi:hypothetical protein
VFFWNSKYGLTAGEVGVRQQKNNEEKFRFKSFMVELVVAHLVDSGVSMADYTIALEKVFAYIVKSQLKSRIYFTDYSDHLSRDKEK